MVGAAGRAETARGRASELALIAPRGSLRWPVLIAAGLLSAALALALLQSLASQRFPGAPRAHRSALHAGLSSLPLTAQGPVSRALGADEPAYRVRASQGGFSAVSREQHLSVSFDRSGVAVSSGATRVGLSLRAVGYGGALTTLGAIAPRMTANRVVYPHADLSEWYANGPLGLEQGFTIPAAPPGHAAGALTLAIALSGNAHAAIAPGGQSITLAHDGGPALRYTGLTATDARGRTLHAWLELRGQQLLLHVDCARCALSAADRPAPPAGSQAHRRRRGRRSRLRLQRRALCRREHRADRRTRRRQRGRGGVGVHPGRHHLEPAGS